MNEPNLHESGCNFLVMGGPKCPRCRENDAATKLREMFPEDAIFVQDNIIFIRCSSEAARAAMRKSNFTYSENDGDAELWFAVLPSQIDRMNRKL